MGLYRAKHSPNGRNRGLILANTDIHLIEKCSNDLLDLGIANAIYQNSPNTGLGSKTVWRIHVMRRDAIIKFASLIGFECSDKVGKLSNLLASYQCFCETCGDLIPLGKRLRKYCDKHLTPQALQNRKRRKNEMVGVR